MKKSQLLLKKDLVMRFLLSFNIDIFCVFLSLFSVENRTFAIKSCGCLWMLIFGFPLYLQHVHASCSYRDTVDFEEGNNIGKQR